MRTQQEGAIFRAESQPSADTEFAGALILGFPGFRIVNSKVLLFINYLAQGILL
jgi:hypothetical protein